MISIYCVYFESMKRLKGAFLCSHLENQLWKRIALTAGELVRATEHIT